MFEILRAVFAFREIGRGFEAITTRMNMNSISDLTYRNINDKHCKGCQIWERKEGSTEYNNWKLTHIYSINHNDSSGSMEAAGAIEIFRRNIFSSAIYIIMTVHVVSILCYLIFRYVDGIFMESGTYIYLEEKYDKYEKINIKSTVSGEKGRKHKSIYKERFKNSERKREGTIREAYVAVAVLVTFYL